MRMSKNKWKIIAVVLGVSSFVATKVFMDNAERKERLAQDRANIPLELAKQLSQEIKNRSPIKIDEFTTIEDSSYAADGSVTALYRVSGISREEAKNIDRQEFYRQAVSQLCRSKSRSAIDQGVSFKYDYRDSSDNQIISFSVNRNSCHTNLDLFR